MALDVTEQLLSATHSAMAGGNDAKGEIQDSVMSADDFNSITDFGVFWKTARKLGLTVGVKSDDGKGYKRRHKADLVEDSGNNLQSCSVRVFLRVAFKRKWMSTIRLMPRFLSCLLMT